MAVFQQMQNVRRKLLNIQKHISGIDEKIQKKQKRLDELTGIYETFHLKEKKELMNSISDLVSERTKLSSQLKETVTKSGYRSVDSFMKAFHQSQTLVEEYLKVCEKDKNEGKHPKKDQQKRKSVLDKLHQYDREARQGKYLEKRRKNGMKRDLEIG